ncbi:DHA2 family efflux MFS transporter permease subunit [Nocardioides mangrovicus]|uniref:DHA2 family efflux MFS transporter permease subunit n=1 Tax=Nocardioides mangrovicus TaxID=2478913 RepID=A0A3L8P8G5_9ACTN|nr:DHA2 family efflux MFS transporter permease subunit [Nocardioides mangrovicus]RLV51009.1 DHA2 family efflux MFS transporter permease subunit [Nocardioides mangrovicus]
MSENTGERSYAVLTWLVAATFVVILQETVMVNAIPRLMSEFDVTARTAQWLSTAFMLTTAVVIPLTGWFLQRVTTRTAFAVAMATFCVGTAAAALAPTFWVLLAARIVQAGGGAVMVPLLMTTLMSVVAERDRGRVMGRVTLAMSVAPALGPAVSGVVLHALSWRWMFALVLPVALATSAAGLRRLDRGGEVRATSVDWPSVAASALGFGGVVYGLSQLGADGDAAVSPAVALGVGVVAVACFVVRQLVLQRTGTPLLDLRALLRPTFTVATTLMAVGFMSMIGSMILLPLYLQDVRHLSALQTGLLVAPGGLLMGLIGPKVGAVLDRFGPRPLVVPGSVGVLVGLAAFTRVDLATPIWLLLAAHVLLMVSLAAVFTPAFTLGLGALPAHLYSHGSSILGTSQQVAAAAGTAVVVAVMSSRAADLAASGTAPTAALVGGMQWAFAVGAISALLVVVLALVLVGRRDVRSPEGEPQPLAA